MTKIRMLNLRLPAAMLTSALCAASLLVSWTGMQNQDPERPVAAQATGTAAEDLTLENRMKGINRSLRSVKSFLRDPKGDAPVAHLKTMISGAVAAREQIPEMTADKEEASRPKFLLEYRQGMRDMIVFLLDLELAVLAKDYAKATKLIEDMESHKLDSHDRFKK